MDDSISKQEAIDALERIFDRCEEIEAHLPEGDPDRTGYKMYPDYVTVWKYLKQLPSAQPELPPYVAEIEAEYQKAVKTPYIRKPLAKALHAVWKKHDREDVDRNECGAKMEEE